MVSFINDIGESNSLEEEITIKYFKTYIDGINENILKSLEYFEKNNLNEPAELVQNLLNKIYFYHKNFVKLLFENFQIKNIERLGDVPTIETRAVYTINILSFSIHLGIPALIFPAIYPLSDSVTEVYGKKISYYLTIATYSIVIIFSFLNNFLLTISDNNEIYKYAIDSSIKLTIIGPVGYLNYFIF